MTKYLHSIDLSNWYVCWNLSLNGTLNSAKINQQIVFPFVDNNSISEITITPTPTGIDLMKHPESDRAKVETEFEKIRKLNFSNKPSRFNCLWVAENSEEGKNMLLNMFTDDNRKLLVVELSPQSKIHKADKRWYEEYFEKENEEYIHNYWSGEPFNDSKRWEFLVEGTLIISNEDILFLRKHFLDEFGISFGKKTIENLYNINKI